MGIEVFKLVKFIDILFEDSILITTFGILWGCFYGVVLSVGVKVVVR